MRLAERLPAWRELDNRGARQRPKVVGPQQLQHGVCQLWQIVFQLEPQLGGQERKGFDQAFDIRVATAFAEKPGKLRIVLGEVCPQLLQEAKFFAEAVL
ncbi:hypothetical protein D3C81_1781490 [compost metagenome]